MARIFALSIGLCLMLGLACSRKAESPSAPSDARATSSAPSSGADAASSADALRKQNEYVDVYNELGVLSTHLAIYRESQANLDKAKQIGSYFGPPALNDATIARLERAIKRTAPLPELDPIAAELAPAVTALNATLQEMSRYATEKGFLADKGQKARALHPVYLAQVGKVLDLRARFGEAIRRANEARDTARLKTLSQGTLPYELLNTRLAARRVMALAKRLDGDTKPSPNELSEQVEALAHAFDALKAAGGTATGKKELYDHDGCRKYVEYGSRQVGSGRGLAEAFKTGKPIEPRITDFAKDFNDAIQDANQCDL